MSRKQWRSLKSEDAALAAFVIVGWTFAVYGVGRLAQWFGYPAWWQ